MVFLAATIEGLTRGSLYRFQIRGVNKLGEGPWSPSSYSFNAMASPPGRPMPPFIDECDLTSIKFRWDAPDDNGSAITGYCVFVQHTGLEHDLHRYQNTYFMDNLLPGRSYRIKVKAKNQAGYSGYSDWNAFSDSRTKTDRPERPSPPRPIAGSFNFVTLEGRLPYFNGDPIRAVMVQKRYVEAFSKGGWEPPVEFRVPDGVKIVEEVDYDSQAIQLSVQEMDRKKKLQKEKEFLGEQLFKELDIERRYNEASKVRKKE